MKYLKKTLPEWLLGCFLLFSPFAFSQSVTQSPYSRFGIGDLQSQSFIRQKGMGGTSLTGSGAYNINVNNPASLSSLLLTTFEVGVAGNLTHYESTGMKEKTGSAGLNYFSLGFPIKTKKWGTAFGLLPFSNTGYNIYGYQTNENGVQQKHFYEGSGGINQFFLANAWSPVKGVSLGLNASYLFGTITEVRRVDYDDISYLNTRVTDNANYGDFYFRGGLLFTFDSLSVSPSDSLVHIRQRLKTINDSLSIFRQLANRKQLVDSASEAIAKEGMNAMIRQLEEEQQQAEAVKAGILKKKQRGNWSLTAGFTSSLNSNIHATQDKLSVSYRNLGNIVYVKDTIENIESADGIVKFPMTIGAGLQLKRGTKWLFQSDFMAQNWEDFSKFGEQDSLANSWNAAFGVQYTPNDRSIKSYWNSVQYRLGYRYSQSYLELRGHTLTEYAITAGLGLPMKRVATVFNLFAEIGTRGTMQNNLIREKFIRFGIGVTLSDRWFVKSQYE